MAALLRGLGSSTQQAFCRSVYTPALLATIVFGGIGIPAAHGTPQHKTGFSLTPGVVLRNIKICFRGGGLNDTGPSVRARRGPFCQGFGGPIFPHKPLVGPCPQIPSGLLRFREGCGILKLSAGPARACCFFCFMVPKWCPTLQNHAVTGYAALFAGFEKMPISCGFAVFLHKKSHHPGDSFL